MAGEGPAADAAEIQTLLEGHGYLADRGLATSVAVAVSIEKPLLLEGDAGVGKTELAKALAAALGTALIRLQCYEGLDVAHALYDWNYARQMLYIRTVEATGVEARSVDELFGPEFLLPRPLLQALRYEGDGRPVLLIDELDRTDDEFEAFLLELLSDFQVTIPEIGTVSATRRPIVLITSNRTRELHDALKRRCLYHWLDHPTPAREAEILAIRVPGLAPGLAEQATRFVAALRDLELIKVPGVAETIDWVRGLLALGRAELDPEAVSDTLGLLLKHREDVDAVRGRELERLMPGSGDA